jgi:hypothetical protein
MTKVVGFPVDVVEQHIRDAARRGQRVTEWQRYTIAAWAQRDPLLPHDPRHGFRNPHRQRYSSIRMNKLPDSVMLPVLCDCSYCGDGALIFPPEDGAPHGPAGTGYCICPCCSFSECEHKQQKRSQGGNHVA